MALTLTSLSNASDLRAQSSDLYSSNYSDCSFVFEFVPMNTSAQFQTTAEFDAMLPSNGFEAVHAVGTLEVSAVNFSRLFYIKTNDLDTLEGNPAVDNMSFGIIGAPGAQGTNVSGGYNPFVGIPFSSTSILAGFANPAVEYVGNTSLYQDYVRFTAKRITGGYALSDIFENEQALLQGVVNMDADFNTAFNGLLDGAKLCEDIGPNVSTGEFAPFLTSCKTLVDNLLNDATSPDNGSVRGRRFLDDLKEQSDARSAYEAQQSAENGNVNNDPSFNGFGDNTYWVIFHPGDVLAVRLEYVPQAGNGVPANDGTTPGQTLGTNPIETRSYKIYLKMTGE